MQISTHPIHGGGRVYLRTDITKLKRIEESLRENELQFRTLVENNHLPLWLTDTYSGVVLYHSPAAAELLGYSWPITEHSTSARSYASPEEPAACPHELPDTARTGGRVTHFMQPHGHESVGARAP